MKKLLVLLAVVLIACMLFSVYVFAAYNYGAPPGVDSHWNFSSDQSYTINGCMDLLYKRGSQLLFRKTSATTNIKAKAYYYAHADVGIQGSDDYFDRTLNNLPDHSGYDYSTTIKARTYDVAQFVRYDGQYYQMSGEHNIINSTEYHYNSDDRVVKNW